MASPTTYSRTQIILHWTVAALFLFQFIMHETMVEAWTNRMNGTIPNEPAFHPHALIGYILLILMLARLFLRFTRGTPALPEDENPALKWIARITHFGLYLFIIVLPLSGTAAWVFGIKQAADGHALFSKILVVLIILHALGALAQHFWFKTNVLKRMLGMA